MNPAEMLEKSKELFLKNAEPPEGATKPITAGRLKGKSDINPQWRIQAMTETFGLYGTGWYVKINDLSIQDVPATGERMVYITVALYIRDLNTGKWAPPAIGIGGDFIIVREKNGFHANDEAFAMALTDALGKAMKSFGVANNVYRGIFDGKKRGEDKPPAPPKQEPAFRFDKENERIYIKGKTGEVDLYDLDVASLEAIVNFKKFEPIKGVIQARIQELTEISINPPEEVEFS